MAAPESMEGTKPDGDPAAFPLKCILCPKKPSFSDMSHLLTHISSKSHLHYKFNLEFTAKADASVKEELEKYEQWYTGNKIEALLSTRLAGKSQKKPGRRGRSTATSSKARQSLSTLDSMKMEISAASSLHTPESLPPLSHWQTAPISHPTLRLNGVRDSSYVVESAYQSPLAFRQRPAYLYADGMPGIGYDMKHRDFMGSMDSSLSTGPPSEMDTSLSGGFLDDEAQANRLKGVVWPGMDIFDAATVDQKRMRNQRKDGAAVDLLKSTSELITATETVWGPEGDIRKVRDIYASPSVDGTPPSTPPPRKRKTRPRNTTPSRTAATNTANIGDGDIDSSKKRRAARPSFAGAAALRQTRAAAKLSDKGGKKKNMVSLDSVDEPAFASAPRQKSSFNVYYEGSATSPGEIQSSTAAVENVSENGFEQNQHSRSVLQNLDPNLTIRSESSPYFKHASSTARFFDNGQEASHMSFPPQASAYGNGFHGMNSAALNTLCSQPRSTTMYPTFHNTMFNGPPGSEPSPSSFPPVSDRRLGFAGYGMDPNNSPFGYSDQREIGLRESGFSDPSYRGAPGLFDM